MELVDKRISKAVLFLFSEYRKDAISLDSLIGLLEMYQKTLKDNKVLTFTFYEGGSRSITLYDIRRNLILPKSNQLNEYMNGCFDRAIENPKEFYIEINK